MIKGEMEINRENYESWFLDYLDGKLDAGQEEILRTFLKFNPDLGEELEGLGPVSLDAGDIRYEMKLALRKPSLSPDRRHILDHFEDYCLLSIENQLSGPEQETLMDIIKADPHKGEIYKLYRSTLLKADHLIRYSRKTSLRRRFIQVPRVRLAIGTAAAAVLLMWLIPLMFKVTRGPVAVQDNPTGVEKSGTEQGKPSLNPESFSGRREEMQAASPETLIVPAVKNSSSGSVKTSGGRDSEKSVDFPKGEIPGTLPAEGNSPDSVQVSGEHEGARTGTLNLSLIASLGAEPLVYRGGLILSPAPETSPSGTAVISSSESSFTIAENTGPGIERRRNRKFTFWNLASAGLRRISEISDESYSLEREADDQGHTRWVKVESPVFGISAPMKAPGAPGK